MVVTLIMIILMIASNHPWQLNDYFCWSCRSTLTQPVYSQEQSDSSLWINDILEIFPLNAEHSILFNVEMFLSWATTVSFIFKVDITATDPSQLRACELWMCLLRSLQSVILTKMCVQWVRVPQVSSFISVTSAVWISFFL